MVRWMVYISQLGVIPALFMCPGGGGGPCRPIAPLCNTQENLPPAQVQASEKQTPSVTCLRQRAPNCRGPPPPPCAPLLPPPPIHPSPFSFSPSFSLYTRNLIITGLHSNDLSFHRLLKTDRSGLRRGACEAERDSA